MPDYYGYALDINLEHGVIPISKAATALAALLKRARAERRPIVITQKGYPSAVVLDIEIYTKLRELAAQYRRGQHRADG